MAANLTICEKVSVMKRNILKAALCVLASVSTIFSNSIAFADNDGEKNDTPVNTVYEDIKSDKVETEFSNENNNIQEGIESNQKNTTTEKQLKEESSEKKEDMSQADKPKLETVNNYFIGTFRLYDEQTGKIYDFQANKAFTYDYKQKLPPLKVDEWSFDVFTAQIEDYFTNKHLKEILYPQKIGNTNKYKIITKKLGEKKIDKAKFKNELMNRIRIADYTPLKVPFINNEQIDSNILKNEVVLFSSYTTKYNAYDTGRTSNIVLAGEEINGTKLAPNEQFKYNTRISPIYPNLRTAKVILNNKFVEGTGGGLCQVSTTLFNATLESGLQIDHRRCHTLPVHYVPRGRDAMVSDYNDFVFRNNFPHDIYITYQRTANDEITFNIYGNRADKKNIKIWTSGRGLSYVLYRAIEGSTVEEKFYSNYQTPSN